MPGLSFKLPEPDSHYLSLLLLPPLYPLPLLLPLLQPCRPRRHLQLYAPA